MSSADSASVQVRTFRAMSPRHQQPPLTGAIMSPDERQLEIPGASIRDDTLDGADTSRTTGPKPASSPLDGHDAKAPVAADFIGESKYEVLGTLGKGGMGEVQLGRDRRLDRNVAIKRIRTDATITESDLLRFQREARTAARVSHPNVVQIYELEMAADGSWFIVMEYIEGQTLKDRLANGRIPLADALQMAISICEGLIAAHQQGVIHRDIKPANIMLTRADVPRILDFGLARFDDGSAGDHSLTGDSERLLTRYYCSPEQELLPARELDARTDIYSLGQTIYHMVTGDIPHPVDMDQVPERLRDSLKRALKMRRDERFQTMDAFREALVLVRNQIREVIPPATPLHYAQPGPSAQGAVCNSCGAVNPLERKFCGNCGSGMTEPCLGDKCDQMISTSEKFCPHCGTDILRRVAERSAIYEDWCRELETAATNHDYRNAARVAKLVEAIDHPRFRTFRQRGETLLRTMEASRSEIESLVRDAAAKAGHLLSRDLLDSADQQLDRIPESMLQFKLSIFMETPQKIRNRIAVRRDELKRQHETRVQAEKSRISDLLNRAQKFQEQADFEAAINLLKSITVPDMPELATDAVLVEQTIADTNHRRQAALTARDEQLSTARQLMQDRKFDQAGRILDQIPDLLKSDEIRTVRQQVDVDLSRIRTTRTAITAKKTTVETLRAGKCYGDAEEELRSFLAGLERDLLREPELQEDLNELVQLQTRLKAEHLEYVTVCRQRMNEAEAGTAAQSWAIAVDSLVSVAEPFRDDRWRQLTHNLLVTATQAAHELRIAGQFVPCAEILLKITPLTSDQSKPTREEIQKWIARDQENHQQATKLLA
ncbi:MAG: protein kinase, partial [Planctomycetaceae bacterium]|nr:protein kinase [Planctomycetaceae bacterium]